MRTSKLFLFAGTFVLLVGSYAGAMAQGKMDRNRSAIAFPPLPIVSIVKVNAIEVSDGTLGVDNLTKQETAFGYSFLGRTSGSLPGSFTLSMNCAPAIPVPGETMQISGGSWTLPIYMTEVRTGYAGSLYGTIAKGDMTWDKTGTSANVYIVLNVDGGTQSWNGASGYATFAGTLTESGDKGQKTTLTGDMVFTLIGAGK